MGEMTKYVTLWGKGKVRIKALIDTGSSTSYVLGRIAKRLQLPEGEKVWVHDDSGRVRGYDTAARISFREGFKISIALIAVEKQGYPLLIGQDFLQREDVVVNFIHDTISVAKKYRRRKFYR